MWTDSQLLISANNNFHIHKFTKLIDLVDSDDILVLNETKVNPSRLKLTKNTGGKVEILVLEIKNKFTAVCLTKGLNKKIKDPRSFADGKKIVKIIKAFLKINCKLSKLDDELFNFAKKNNLKINIFKNFKSIQNLKKLNHDINFVTNFGRDVEYYTGIVFEVFSGTKEIASGGRYDDLLKSLGAKKRIPAVGAAINLKNIWKI